MADSTKGNVKGLVSSVADATKESGKPVNLYDSRFRFSPDMTSMLAALSSRNFDEVQTIKRGNMYHHIGLKDNQTVHILSSYANPAAGGMAAILVGHDGDRRYVRAAHSRDITGNHLKNLDSYVQDNPEWAYEEPLQMDAQKHMDMAWAQHHPDLVHNLVPDVNLLPRVEHTISPWLSFAGVRGDSTPRVIAKQALDATDVSVNPVAKSRWSSFSHPTFTTAHREAAYSRLAHEIFGLGEYVPRTTVFNHPLSKKPWSAMEFIAGAKPADYIGKAFTGITKNNDVFRLAIMNAILANNDRHRNNIIQDATGNIKLIDHGLAFDYGHITTNVDPAYALHVLNKAVPEEVHRWLWSIDTQRFRKALEQMGAPSDVTMHAVGRLVDARAWSHLVKHGAKGYDLKDGDRCLKGLFDMIKTRRTDIPAEARAELQSRIKQRILTGMNPVVVPKPAEQEQTTAKIDGGDIPSPEGMKNGTGE
jgi:hypothetical protein